MIDANILIGNIYPSDQYHKETERLLPEFVKRHGEVHLTDYVFLEVINFLTKKVGRHEAEKTIEKLLTSNKIKIIYNTPETFLQTANEYKNYSNLSFTDVNIVIQMRRHGLKELLSFDAGFDEVKEIKRIH